MCLGDSISIRGGIGGKASFAEDARKHHGRAGSRLSGGPAAHRSRLFCNAETSKQTNIIKYSIPISGINFSAASVAPWFSADSLLAARQRDEVRFLVPLIWALLYEGQISAETALWAQLGLQFVDGTQVSSELAVPIA